MARFVNLFRRAILTLRGAGGTPPEPPPEFGILAANSVFIVGAGGVFITSEALS